MLALKLLLIALSVTLSTWAGRRFGQFVGGAISGLPVIAGPIMGFVGWQMPASDSQAVGQAVIACVPAAVAHLLTFAHASRRVHWSVALMAANAVFLVLSYALLNAGMGAAQATGLALAAPVAALWLMPRVQAPARAAREAARGAVSAMELSLRIGAALLLALVVFYAAPWAPAEVSGALLAIPITGNVLPCFLLARSGYEAAIGFVVGFMKSFLAFAAFFAVLAYTLGEHSFQAAYLAAWGAAAAVAATTVAVSRLARR